MIKQPTNINELYAFFVPNLAKPPMKPDYICSDIQLDRAGWHVNIYRVPKGNTFAIWFYPHPTRAPKWAISYDKFTDTSQES